MPPFNLYAQLCSVFLLCGMKHILWLAPLSSLPHPKCMRQHYKDLRHFQCHISEYDCTQRLGGIFLSSFFNARVELWRNFQNNTRGLQLASDGMCLSSTWLAGHGHENWGIVMLLWKVTTKPGETHKTTFLPAICTFQLDIETESRNQ